MWITVLIAVCALVHSDASEHSELRHPILRMFYKPVSHIQPSYDLPYRSRGYSNQEDPYLPESYRPPSPNPVYDPAERREFYPQYPAETQDFSRDSPLFSPNPSYGLPYESNLFSQLPTSQEDVGRFQNHFRSPSQSETFYPPERNDISYQSSGGQLEQPGSFQTYERPSFNFRPENGPSNRYNSRPPFNPSRGSSDRDSTYRPQGGFSEGSRSSSPLKVLYSWKLVDFEFPSDSTRDEMIRKQEFIPKNNLILDMDIYERGSDQTIFVTIPRVRPGVPVSLATVSSRKRRGANLLVPFPDWRSHRPGDCDNAITSVLRTHIDECGRLWVLDSGNNDAFVTGSSRLVCPPQVLIYDLNNSNRLMGKYRFPESMLSNNSLMVTINVDTRTSDCSDSIAYIADSFGNKLLGFNLQTRQFWRTNSSLFYPYPDQRNFSVNGVRFQLSGGIFGLALSPLYRGDRRLYFHCIDSIKQSYVDTADIRDPRPWLRSIDARPQVFRELRGSRSSQSAAAAMDEQGVMFFGLIGSNEMACWNANTDFGSENIEVLAKDDTNLQFNSGVKTYRGKLYAVSNRLQNYVTNQVREDEENYRILVGDIRQMVRNTKCDVREFMGFGGGRGENGQSGSGGGNRPNGGGNRPNGVGNQPFGGGNRPNSGGNQPCDGGNQPFGGGNQPNGGGNRPIGGGNRPNGGDNQPYDGGNQPFGGGNQPYGGGNRPHSHHDNDHHSHHEFHNHHHDHFDHRPIHGHGGRGPYHNPYIF